MKILSAEEIKYFVDYHTERSIKTMRQGGVPRIYQDEIDALQRIQMAMMMADTVTIETIKVREETHE